MSGDAFNVNLTADSELLEEDILTEGNTHKDLSIDARRRLEERLEERRLLKDLQEFDFDF